MCRFVSKLPSAQLRPDVALSRYHLIARGAEQLGWELEKLLYMTLQAMAAGEDLINSEMEAYERESSYDL